MYSAYTPMLRSNEKTMEMEEVFYSSELDHDDIEIAEKQETELMEEVIETVDAYQIVCTEFDMGNDGIRSLVSMTKTANSSEKVKKNYNTTT